MPRQAGHKPLGIERRRQARQAAKRNVRISTTQEAENRVLVMETFIKTFLSKSRYIRGLQCQKSLYLYTNHPELRDEVTEDQEALFGIGTDVGLLARSLFPGGVKIPFDGMSISDQIKTTSEEIDKGAAILYEGAFSANNVFVKADILRKGGNGWEIYEVKASTKVKDHHYDDVAVQYHVLKGTGLSISKAFVVFVNNQYVRHGDLDIHSLLNIQDVTEEVLRKEKEVIENIRIFQHILGQDCPVIDVGEHCEEPYGCDFMGHCWANIPDDSVLYLRGRGANRYELYRQGIKSMQDIPLDVLSHNQRMQVIGTLEKKDFINVENIKSFLESLYYPLCFLDFETISVPIPPFNDIRPYQKIPFQFSIDVQDRENADLRHYEFLADPSGDFRAELLRHLLACIPEEACILAYNKSFEIGCFNTLASWFPLYQTRIDQVIDRFTDLMTPFRKRDVYLSSMHGSHSLKLVLPALVPELSYNDLEIQDGGMASSTFLKLFNNNDDEEKGRIRKALLDYCGLDTLAMVKIVEKLKTYVTGIP